MREREREEAPPDDRPLARASAFLLSVLTGVFCWARYWTFENRDDNWCLVCPRSARQAGQVVVLRQWPAAGAGAGECARRSRMEALSRAFEPVDWESCWKSLVRSAPDEGQWLEKGC